MASKSDKPANLPSFENFSLSGKKPKSKPTPLATAKPKITSQKKTEPVAESWEDDASSGSPSSSSAETDSSDENNNNSVNDEDEDNDNDTETETETETAKPHRHPGTEAPPPTPASPSARFKSPLSSPTTRTTTAKPSSSSSSALAAASNPDSFSYPFDHISNNISNKNDESTSRNLPSSRRPETTTSTASRLIAGALGVRAPRMTDEQRAYDRAAKERERKRREREKREGEERKREGEERRRAVWED